MATKSFLAQQYAIQVDSHFGELSAKCEASVFSMRGINAPRLHLLNGLTGLNKT